MPTAQKESIIAEIKGRIASSDAFILTDYRGLSVKEMQELRNKLREQGGELSVYKNSLTQIAVRELGLEGMDDMLQGPTAFLFVEGDPVGPAKALTAFAKEHAALETKGGWVQDQLADASAIAALAALPSREELIAKLMGTMLNPVRQVMLMANAPAGALTRVMKAVADQKAAA